MNKTLGLLLEQHRLIAALIVIFFCAGWASADPLTFSNVVALQNGGGPPSVDLFSSPNATLSGPQISFLVDITGTLPINGTDALIVTYIEEGSAPVVQTFNIPLFGSVDPPFTLLFNVTPLNPTIQGTKAILILDLQNSAPDFVIPSGPNAGSHVNSQSYAITLTKPVPEPATLALLGVGLTGLVRRMGRRRRDL